MSYFGHFQDTFSEALEKARNSEKQTRDSHQDEVEEMLAQLADKDQHLEDTVERLRVAETKLQEAKTNAAHFEMRLTETLNSAHDVREELQSLRARTAPQQEELTALKEEMRLLKLEQDKMQEKKEDQLNSKVR